MKKTLVVLLSLVGLAEANTTPVTLGDFTQIDIASRSYTWNVTSTTPAPTGWTLSMTLDASMLKSYMADGTTVYKPGTTGVSAGALVSGSADSGLQIVDVTLVGGNRIGIDTNFGSSASETSNGVITSSGLYGSWNGGKSGSTQETPNGVGNYSVGSFDFSGLEWSKIGSIAITLSYQYTNAAGNGTNLAIALYDTSGTLVESSDGSNTDLRTSAALQSIAFSDAVKSAYLYDSRITETEAVAITKALGKSAVVPEPTTATLSLLALAGLAVRRRRK